MAHDGAEQYIERIKRLAANLPDFFVGMKEDLEMAGKAGASAIVATTLAGIGEEDQPFAPYSRAYQEILDSVGGKARGTVDLRGIFYKTGQKRVAFRSEQRRRDSRAGRRANVRVVIGRARPDALFFEEQASFFAKTAETRPALGLTDPRSEMSLDLIKVEATDTKLTMAYTPREKPYMLYHNEGAGKLPKRKWFTFAKAAVRTGMLEIIKLALQARMRRVFFDGR